MEKNGITVLSPFFLVEVTGDSEVDCDWSLESNQLRASMDEDDAESSCSGIFSVKAAVSGNGGVVREESEVRVKSWLQQQETKSCVSADSSTVEFLNEMEKNKLFWETCLAS